MKKLIVSLKSSSDVLDDFSKAFQEAKNGKLKEHYEISFDKKSDFEKFIRNLTILRLIVQFKPSSIYELSKILQKDVSNLTKIVKFYESHGVITIKKDKKDGRELSRPVVNYKKIEFDLAA